MASIALSAASESLYIETVPRLHASPDILETALRHTNLFAGNKSLDKRFAPVMVYLVGADQIAHVIAGIAVVAGFDLVFDPIFHEVGFKPLKEISPTSTLCASVGIPTRLGVLWWYPQQGGWHADLPSAIGQRPTHPSSRRIHPDG
jgi:hypothetical protein